MLSQQMSFHSAHILVKSDQAARGVCSSFLFMVGEKRMCETCFFSCYSESYGAALFLNKSSQYFMVMLV